MWRRVGKNLFSLLPLYDACDTNILGHGEQHLTDVLHVRFFLILDVDVVDLRQSIDEHRDLRTEFCGDRWQIRLVRAVLHRIVQKRGANGVGIQPECGYNLCDGDGMGDVRIPADTELSLVERCRIQKCPVDFLQIIVLAACFQNVQQFVDIWCFM